MEFLFPGGLFCLLYAAYNHYPHTLAFIGVITSSVYILVAMIFQILDTLKIVKKQVVVEVYTFVQMLPTVAVNFFLQHLAIGGGLYYTNRGLTDALSYRVVFDLLMYYVIFDCVFYFGHRLIHHKYLYKYIHKMHHKTFASISISNNYMTQIDLLIQVILPSLAAPIIGNG